MFRNVFELMLILFLAKRKYIERGAATGTLDAVNDPTMGGPVCADQNHLAPTF